MKKTLKRPAMAVWSACVVAGSAGAAIGDEIITTFDNGTEGWSISGRDTIRQTGGNPGANMQGLLTDVFGADVRNNTNSDFLGDLTRFGPMELSIDVKVNSIANFNGEVPREFVVEVRDYDNDNGYPWTSVWFSLGVLAAESIGGPDGWATYSVIIDDPFAEELPAGWGGYGAEDPDTFEPILPDGRTFASVLQSADELAFTTFVPGFFFGFTQMDLQVDNVAVRTIPAPSALAALAMGGALVARRRR